MAREVPEMRRASMMGHQNMEINFNASRNDELIKAVALSNDKIIDYFSQEIVVKNMYKRENSFLYPYLDAIIETMLSERKNDSAEFLMT